MSEGGATAGVAPGERRGGGAGHVAGGAWPPERIGYLGLGSNVGDRRAQLTAAVQALPRHGVRVLASSSTYETEPVGEILDQPDFLNACLRIATAHDPDALLDACKAVERELGRESGPEVRRHAPRPIDVDVLLLGDLTYASERLRLPHAEVTSRRFVLIPLLELDPALATPDGVRSPTRSPRSTPTCACGSRASR
jgi:2-amino-4-hydroxy-6-hydroxymethyldihydropteridine diphosphokinase